MWKFRKTKEKDPEYERIHTMEWLREQITDWEAEQIRLAVRAGTADGVIKGTDVPGGEGSGVPHIAAPARGGPKLTKAQRQQSAKDKALNGAGHEAPAAGFLPERRAPRAKAKATAKGTGNAKTAAPQRVCLEYWDQGEMCDRGRVKTGAGSVN